MKKTLICILTIFALIFTCGCTGWQDDGDDPRPETKRETTSATVEEIETYIRDNIKEGQSLEEMVKVFDKASSMKYGDDDLSLIECWKDGDECSLYLVKQCSTDDDGYYQITVEIFYDANRAMKWIEDQEWIESYEDFYKIATNNKAYRYLKDKEYKRIEIDSWGTD